MEKSESFNFHQIEWTPEKIKRRWDMSAQDSYKQTTYFTVLLGKGMIYHFKKRGLHLDGSILDLGCGIGGLMKHLLLQGFRVAGVDASPESIKQVNHNFAEFPNFLGAHTGRLEEIPLEDNYASYVIMAEILEHTFPENIPGIFKEVSRVLKPGGFLIISVPNNENLSENMVGCPDCGAVFHIRQHMQSFDKQSLAKLFANFGFEDIFIENTHFGYYIFSILGKIIYKLRKFKKKEASPHLFGFARLYK